MNVTSFEKRWSDRDEIDFYSDQENEEPDFDYGDLDLSDTGDNKTLLD